MFSLLDFQEKQTWRGMFLWISFSYSLIYQFTPLARHMLSIYVLFYFSGKLRSSSLPVVPDSCLCVCWPLWSGLAMQGKLRSVRYVVCYLTSLMSFFCKLLCVQQRTNQLTVTSLYGILRNRWFPASWISRPSSLWIQLIGLHHWREMPWYMLVCPALPSLLPLMFSPRGHILACPHVYE